MKGRGLQTLLLTLEHDHHDCFYGQRPPKGRDHGGCVLWQQEDAGDAVVVAVTSRALFESGLEDDDAGVWKLSLAFPLLQVRTRLNPVW